MYIVHTYVWPGDLSPAITLLHQPGVHLHEDGQDRACMLTLLIWPDLAYIYSIWSVILQYTDSSDSSWTLFHVKQVICNLLTSFGMYPTFMVMSGKCIFWLNFFYAEQNLDTALKNFDLSCSLSWLFTVQLAGPSCNNFISCSIGLIIVLSFLEQFASPVPFFNYLQPSSLSRGGIHKFSLRKILRFLCLFSRFFPCKRFFK
jgi:hypothetical protein